MAVVTICRPPCGNPTLPLWAPPAVWTPTAAAPAAAPSKAR